MISRLGLPSQGFQSRASGPGPTGQDSKDGRMDGQTKYPLYSTLSLWAADLLTVGKSKKERKAGHGYCWPWSTGSFSGYANTVHSDIHPESAYGFFAFIAMGEGQAHAQGRYLYMNLWRSIDDENPLLRDHLAMVDQTSLTHGVNSEVQSSVQHHISYWPDVEVNLWQLTLTDGLRSEVQFIVQHHISYWPNVKVTMWQLYLTLGVGSNVQFVIKHHMVLGYSSMFSIIIHIDPTWKSLF